jgi:phage regulator Rha-like protein
LKKRRNFLNRIYISDADIKYTSNKAKIILYTINKEKKALKLKYFRLKQKITFNLLDKLNQYYNDIIQETYTSVQNFYKKKNDSLLVVNYVNKKNLIKHKLKYLQAFQSLSQLLLKKT